MEPLSIFISHHHEEKLLAHACQELFRTLTCGQVVAWHSSDERASGGIGPGEWRQDIRQRLESANVILVLITPISNDKPWVFFESGFASGQKKEIIPVCFFMSPDSISQVFRSLQCYRGDCRDGATGMLALCGKLMRMHQGVEPPESSKEPWKAWIEKYMTLVLQEREQSHTRNLFQDHFHNLKAASGMEGRWFAKWTELRASGPENVFEVDEIIVWTTDSRLRMVGTSAKAGRNLLSGKGKEAARYYPMEGVVSRLGWVALSDWSGGEIPICGTALLAPCGSTGEILEGTWQGFTARNIQEKPSLTQGRVVMARSRSVVEGYWPELHGIPLEASATSLW